MVVSSFVDFFQNLSFKSKSADKPSKKVRSTSATFKVHPFQRVSTKKLSKDRSRVVKWYIFIPKSQFGYMLEDLGMENVGLYFYGHLKYLFFGILVHFLPFVPGDKVHPSEKKFTPRGQSSPLGNKIHSLGTKLNPGGQVHP
jgi:hypothetical protein